MLRIACIAAILPLLTLILLALQNFNDVSAAEDKVCPLIQRPLGYSNLNIHCPEGDGEHLVLFPDPSDCSSFYQCSNAVAYGYNCPEGLHFNRNLKICTSPLDASCLSQQMLPMFTCPDEDGDVPVYFPDPNDCSNFYQCSNGVAYLLSCDEGLYFDEVLNVCVFPNHANCHERPHRKV